MKKFLCITFLLCLTAVFADDIQVRVAIDAARNSFALKKDLENRAKKSAIRKYILKLNSQTPEKLIEEACNEYSNLVDGIKVVSAFKWIKTGVHSGQLSAEFSVDVETDKVNSWLKEKGFSHQSGIELVVMEEPPSLAQIQISKAFGTDMDGGKFFLRNYTTFQRRLRDAIIKKVDTFGFDVKLLADNDLYEKYKTLDSTLVGVYFDVESNNFTINHDLLKTVKENNPDTLVLYYRIDSLIYNPQSREISATVAFNIKDLNSNATKSVGAQDYTFPSNATQQDEVMRDLAYCAEAAMNTLMNSEGMAEKLNSVAMSIKNAANIKQGPLKLIVNASVFEKKVRKKAMYMLKKELIAQKISSASNIKSSNTTLTATIDNPKIKETDALYMEYISPILEKIGVELEDDKVNYSGNTLTIKP